MTPSSQSAYDLLEDSEFDMTDASEEDEEEEEEEEEVEKEGGSDSLNSYFRKKSRHYSDYGDDIPEDEDALWSANAQKGPQGLSGMAERSSQGSTPRGETSA
ncbi:hypothetical protein EC957_006877 [Mortierella hygrophila]|uniref:Uncharacterized protein n=1 Tax=Mortierella hygrophila TaxID=979708 RepID=A0A9P6EYT8_9FUNG|nr:hypothetical protein EC957_006877 [Mortierella hygrophila]